MYMIYSNKEYVKINFIFIDYSRINTVVFAPQILCLWAWNRWCLELELWPAGKSETFSYINLLSLSLRQVVPAMNAFFFFFFFAFAYLSSIISRSSTTVPHSPQGGDMLQSSQCPTILCSTGTLRQTCSVSEQLSSGSNSLLNVYTEAHCSRETCICHYTCLQPITSENYSTLLCIIRRYGYTW